MIEQIAALFPLLLLSTATQIIIPAPVDLIALGMTRIGINPLALIFTITIGMLIGASFDYYIGRYGIETVSWLKKKTDSRDYRKAEHFYKKYGCWTLLFTFLPFVGKYFPFISGLMELSYKKMLSLFVFGKLLYYGFWGILILKSGVL